MGSGDGVRCMLMRGGTSKGAYFLAEDLPSDPAERDDLLLRVMGSPDARQIDGIGGAQPPTPTEAVISPSAPAAGRGCHLCRPGGARAAPGGRPAHAGH